MSTLSDAVARVIRRELGDRQEDITEFGKRAGKTPTTGWRQITGVSRMSIDDVAAYAQALGWSLEDLLVQAKAAQAETEDAPESKPVPQEIADMLSPDALKDVQRKQRRPARKSPTVRRTGS